MSTNSTHAPASTITAEIIEEAASFKYICMYICTIQSSHGTNRNDNYTDEALQMIQFL